MTGLSSRRIADRRAFPPDARLRAGPEFSAVFRNPERFADRYFTLLARRKTTGPGRLGLAIAKKQARRAVDRNRLKRLAREAFRHRQHDLRHLDIVLMVRHAAVEADNAVLRTALERLFDRVGQLPMSVGP